jgi:hypothetical protein
MLSLNLPQILILAQAHHRGSGGRIKTRPALPKRAALNRRDHAKITSRAQRRGGAKRSISAGIYLKTGEGRVFAKTLEMAVREAAQRYLPALPVQEPWN